MNDDYLWDRSGEPDDLVVELEDKLSGLAFEPVFIVDAASVVPEEAPAPSGRKTFVLGAVTAAAAIAAALLVFGWGYEIGGGNEPELVAHTHVPSPQQPAAGASAADVEDDAKKSDEAIVGAPGGVEGPHAQNDGLEAGAPTVDPERPEPVVAKPTAPSKPKHTTGAKSQSSAKSGSAGRKNDGNVDVDCILDPRKCKKVGTRPVPASKPASMAQIPEKLTTSDIKAGVAVVKPKAIACGAKHGAASGTKVKVKLSIAGATGTVTSATAQPPFTRTPLGLCVAKALKKAKFKKFRKSIIGAIYPVTM